MRIFHFDVFNAISNETLHVERDTQGTNLASAEMSRKEGMRLLPDIAPEESERTATTAT